MPDGEREARAATASDDRPATGLGAVDTQRQTFLQQLTAAHPRLVVWKHLDRALCGRGDIDAAAPAADAEAIVTTALRVGQVALGATVAVECRHVADKTLLFFVQPHRLPQLFELDVCHQPSRGLAPWASPEALLDLSRLDDGIRRLRPGAEAIVSLVYHGLSIGGRDRLSGDELMLLRQGVSADPDGATLACRRLAPRPALRPLVRILQLAGQRQWEPGSARLAWFAMATSGARHPGFVARRGWFRLRLLAGRDCVMSDLARRHGRRVDADALADLLARAHADGHRIHLS